MAPGPRYASVVDRRGEVVVVSTQLDSALAVLATRAGTAVDQLGPEAMKAYGGGLHAQVHVLGVFLILLLLATALLALWAKFSDSEGVGLAAIICLVGSGIAGTFYCAAVIELASYTASPAGATAMHLVGR